MLSPGPDDVFALSENSAVAGDHIPDRLGIFYGIIKCAWYGWGSGNCDVCHTIRYEIRYYTQTPSEELILLGGSGFTKWVHQ
jgi:hypothetical protein